MAPTTMHSPHNPELGETVPSFARTLENTPLQQRLTIPPLLTLSAPTPPVYVGVPTGEFSTDLVLYGVPRRATGLEIRNELISLGLSRLTEGTFVRQGAECKWSL